MKPMVSMIFFPQAYRASRRCAAGFVHLLEPPEPRLGAGLRLVLRADPALVADAVEVLVEERIVDLARPRLVTAGIVRKLDMRDAAEVCLDGTGEIPLHDLHVVDIVLKIEVFRADAVDDIERLPRRVEEESGNVARVDRLDQQPDSRLLQPLRRVGQIVDEDVLQLAWETSSGAMPARQFTCGQPSALA